MVAVTIAMVLPKSQYLLHYKFKYLHCCKNFTQLTTTNTIANGIEVLHLTITSDCIDASTYINKANKLLLAPPSGANKVLSTTPGGANKASLIQYSRQAPKTTKDVKLTKVMREKRLMMTHSQSTRGRWTLKRYISSSPWQAWEREAKCYIFLRSPTYPGVDDACLLGGPHEQGVED